MKYVLSQSERSESTDKLLQVLQDRFHAQVSTMTVIETNDDIVWDIIEALGAKPLPEPVVPVAEKRRYGPKPGTKYKKRKPATEPASTTETVAGDDGASEVT